MIWVGGDVGDGGWEVGGQVYSIHLFMKVLLKNTA